MKQVLIQKGQVRVEDVPSPMVQAGCALVQVDRSCISIGTEMSGIRSSGTPLWKKALAQPEKAKKAFDLARQQGLSQARTLLESKLFSPQPTGYSAAGTVIEVGAGIHDLKPGDRVACAGAQCAYHAELICVPRNLIALMPENLEFAEASTVTLGAIALQGVRRAHPTLGETFVVIGLGILGQITAQLLRANGCRVIGVDLDATRLSLALKLGMESSINPAIDHDISQIARLTDGAGADGVIITAASSSDQVISSAFQMCRKKGRVVLVGDVGLDLNRADFYEKELDFFISTSYGPGRYDRAYEEEGLDYPIGYVRWTENRNMQEYLRLLSSQHVQITPLIEATHPIEDAPTAYKTLESEKKPLMVLLAYSPSPRREWDRVITNPAISASKTDRVRLGLAGAGGYAKAMHLPHIAALSEHFQLQSVMSRSGHNALAASRQFKAAKSTTDFQELLDDHEIDAVLISTRHNLHATMALEALKTGKHVFVEKPLALAREELQGIERFYEEAGGKAPLLLTGFNRRFSPYAERLQEILSSRSNPIMVNYRMNAGHIPLNHWVHGPEGGGRNLGEACHIYDLFTFLTQSRVVRTQAQALRPTTDHYSPRDNFIATFSFEDGSVCSLTYTALGSPDYPKERCEVYFDGKIAVLEDFQNLKVFGAKARDVKTKIADKGQRKILEAFAHAIKSGAEWPIPLWQQMQVAAMGWEVEAKLS